MHFLRNGVVRQVGKSTAVFEQVRKLTAIFGQVGKCMYISDAPICGLHFSGRSEIDIINVDLFLFSVAFYVLTSSFV
jgi:hypothetical protein